MSELRILATLAIVFRLISSDACGDGQATSPHDITPHDPAFYVHAELDRASQFYRDGDRVSLKITCETDAYIYVLYQQADDRIFQMFPNSAHPNNRVDARKSITLGADDDLFRWTVGAPFGKERITVIASKRQLEVLADPAKRQHFFNPVSKGDVTQLAKDVDDTSASDWTNKVLELRTFDKETPFPKQTRRVALLVGASTELFAAFAKEGHSTGNPHAQRSVEALAAILPRAARLNDMKVLVGSDATRNNIQNAITKWLPSVTEPGDTILMFYHGHSGPFPDNNDDEADGKDEIMGTYDQVSMPQLLPIADAYVNGTLNENQRSVVDRLKAAWRKAGVSPATDGAAAAQICIRETFISDDALGNWIQYLDGRKVIFIVETCHAGGFHNLEKGVDSASVDEELSLDLFHDEGSRLKDIGQQNLALLVACSRSLSSLNRRTKFPRNFGPMGLFASFVAEKFLESEEPFDVQQLWEHCDNQMTLYFDANGDLLKQYSLKRHAPILWNDLEGRVWLNRRN